MEAFLTTIVNGFEAIGKLVHSGYQGLIRLNEWTKAALLGFITWFITFLDWLEGLFQWVSGQFVSMSALFTDPALAAQGSATADMLNFTNAVYPLAETLAIVSVLTAIWLIASAIRIVKSWIPTES